VASLLEVGTGFHPELTGRENIYLNGAILGMSRREIRQRFDDIVAFAEINKFLDTPVKRYSSGMYVRLAFSVAAHLEPEVLLVDEVLAVGDAAFQKKCLWKMGDVASGGRTILFVSHNMAAIQSICSKAIVLDHGQVAYSGPTQDAVKFYLSQMAQKFGANLGTRQDRKGTRDLRFTGVNFLHKEDGKKVDTLISGMPVRIELVYETEAERSLENLDVSIGFFNSFGTLLFACRSSAIGKVFQINQKKGSLYCDIHKWPLSSGLYTYNIYSEQNGMVCDWIRDAGQIQVESGDFYGTGRIPANSMQSILIEYDWDKEGSHSAIQCI
jgi:lipopolysaccharide transport system ATP-binding protein